MPKVTLTGTEKAQRVQFAADTFVDKHDEDTSPQNNIVRRRLYSVVSYKAQPGEVLLKHNTATCQDSTDCEDTPRIVHRKAPSPDRRRLYSVVSYNQAPRPSFERVQMSEESIATANLERTELRRQHSPDQPLRRRLYSMVSYVAPIDAKDPSMTEEKIAKANNERIVHRRQRSVSQPRRRLYSVVSYPAVEAVKTNYQLVTQSSVPNHAKAQEEDACMKKPMLRRRKTLGPMFTLCGCTGKRTNIRTVTTESMAELSPSNKTAVVHRKVHEGKLQRCRSHNSRRRKHSIVSAYQPSDYQ